MQPYANHVETKSYCINLEQFVLICDLCGTINSSYSKNKS